MIEIIEYIPKAQYNRLKLSEVMGLSAETIKNYIEVLVRAI